MAVSRLATSLSICSRVAACKPEPFARSARLPCEVWAATFVALPAQASRAPRRDSPDFIKTVVVECIGAPTEPTRELFPIADTTAVATAP